LIKHNFKPSFKPYIYYLINNIVRKQQKKRTMIKMLCTCEYMQVRIHVSTCNCKTQWVHVNTCRKI